MYSSAMCVRPLLMLTWRFDRQIAACKNGPNLKTKDLLTHVYMKLHHYFFYVKLSTKICTSKIESPCVCARVRARIFIIYICVTRLRSCRSL
jgi:hypothetical protein